MSAYIITLGQREETFPAPSSFVALDKLFAFLNSQINKYNPEAVGDDAWIAALMPNTDVVKQCSRNKATQLIQEYDYIFMYAESTHLGVFAEATATGATTHKANTLVRKANDAANKKHYEIIQQARQAQMKVGEHLPSFDDPALRWHPDACNPVQILWAAEERIFAHNLGKAIDESDLPPDEIEIVADLPAGTLKKMLHPTTPLRPRKSQVEQLAKALRVRPSQLWYDAVKIYLDSNDLWDAYLKPKDDHASL